MSKRGRSKAEKLCEQLAQLPDGVVLDILGEFSTTELAALAHDWFGFWARPKQVPPITRWKSFGFLTGRGFGKTVANGEWVLREISEGRIGRIALMAQNEDKTVEILVEGKSGLLTLSPPWFQPRYIKKRLVWPNGAQAFVYTPEVPGAVRGPEHDLVWATEFVAWPQATMEEAFSNLRLGLRLGEARMVWDSTSKRRHPILRYLLERHERDPGRHIIVRGSTRENLALPPEDVADWYRELGGTQRGREELEGEFFDESDGALWKAAWIEAARREMPDELERRVLSIDPAISTKKGTDQTGLTDQGLGVDGQVYVIANLTRKYTWPAWAKLVVDRYFDTACDCVIAERSRGGDAVVENLRTQAKDGGFRVVVVKPEAKTRHDPRVMYVKETMPTRSKEDRHFPVATMYEKGFVSHVVGGEGLAELEDWLTTWEPSPRSKSPDAIDALVQGIAELARFSDHRPDYSRGFEGLGKLSKELDKTPMATALAEALKHVGSDWGEGL